MRRYLTRWYLTTDESEVERLASIDKTPVGEIRMADDVEPIGWGSGWSYWSDDRLIKRSHDLGELGLENRLSEDARKMITLVVESDGGSVEGGYKNLVNIHAIIARKRVLVGESRGHYNPPNVERVRVRTVDGNEMDLLVYSEGCFEGYRCEVFLSEESFMKWLDKK